VPPLNLVVRQHCVADDWYRNERWTQAIEKRFEERLRRARRKDQYLHLQAAALVDSHPDVAISLIERFLALENPFFPALGYDVKAKALVRLGRIPEALSTYQVALDAELAFPNARTNSATDYAELVVLTQTENLYPQVLELLQRRHSDFAFPVLQFKAHACKAVIFRQQGKLALADGEAAAALAQAERTKSGFRHHPGLGLVGDDQMPLLRLLRGFRVA
jgi:tetratricopeptide (TPR) repeat protein